MINNIEKTLSIIDANYCGKPDSLLGEINDHSFFCNDKFWELYDSILLLVKQKYYDDGITVHISLCYQRLLKEIIYHFSDKDMSNIENFPNDYNGYLERMDYVIHALYLESEAAMSEDLFELKRDV